MSRYLLHENDYLWNAKCQYLFKGISNSNISSKDGPICIHRGLSPEYSRTLFPTTLDWKQKTRDSDSDSRQFDVAKELADYFKSILAESLLLIPEQYFQLLLCLIL